MTSKPMCERWYERAGSYRPWHTTIEGCTCRTSAHAPPGQHGLTCPAYLTPDQRELLAKLILQGEQER